jgi:hypothetical protein
MLDLPNNFFLIFSSVFAASVDQIRTIMNSNILVIKLCQIRIMNKWYVTPYVILRDKPPKEVSIMIQVFWHVLLSLGRVVSKVPKDRIASFFHGKV